MAFDKFLPAPSFYPPWTSINQSLHRSLFLPLPTCLPLLGSLIFPAPLKNRKLRQIVLHNVTITVDVRVRSEPDDRRSRGNCFLHVHGAKPSTLFLKKIILNAAYNFPATAPPLPSAFRRERILLSLQGSQLHSFKCLLLPSGACAAGRRRRRPSSRLCQV